MPLFILAFLLSCSSVSAFGEGKSAILAQVTREQGILYEKSSGERFTGLLKGEGYSREVDDGRFSGLSTYYWGNGRKKNQTQFRDNAAHGFVKWYYRNGQLSYVGRRWQGRENGQQTQCFDERGVLLQRCNRYAMTGGEHGSPSENLNPSDNTSPVDHE